MDYQFSDFIKVVEPQDKEFVQNIHDNLIGDGYKTKIENKATGMFIAFSHPKTKRAFLNLFFRKNGLQARVYAEGHKSYLDFIGKSPEEIEQRITKAKTCDSCGPTCTKGYSFSIRGTDYFKCRYGCFHFEITAANKPFIAELIKLEKATR